MENIAFSLYSVEKGDSIMSRPYIVSHMIGMARLPIVGLRILQLKFRQRKEKRNGVSAWLSVNMRN